MFRLFKRRTNATRKTQPQMLDLEDQPLSIGDHVESMRYELGRCLIIETDTGVEYESVETGERISWVLMIDAATERQKVKKVTDK